MLTLPIFSSNDKFLPENAKCAVLRKLGLTEIIQKILLTLTQNFIYTYIYRFGQT